MNCLHSRDSLGNQAVFGLLSLSAAAGSSINKQRRVEVWDPRVCLVQQRLRGLDRRLSRIIVSPQLEGLLVPQKRKFNLGYLYTSAGFGLEQSWALRANTTTHQRFNRVLKITDYWRL